MAEKTPFDGADNYTDPAEITEDHGVEDPEATPSVVVSIAASASAVSGGGVTATRHFGC
ncbi:LxmA leader domain family RiPP [Nocardiopsis valliformis]|uniref:LxmA leader domain family RiPP n=1 Tax=Nocardiopsis valliformis TaxID=239974 RepID=UPI00034A5574|nr:LxmA leader domain family RiPP [Nocardiopsis valliformis]